MKTAMQRTLSVLIISLLLTVSLLVHAAGSEISVNEAGLGLQGYDPVGYFNQSKPVVGSVDYTYAHSGVTYQFASAANRDAFVADPEKYLPQYGGYCAFGASIGKKFDGDPNVWRVVDDKLYLNLNAKVQERWFTDIPGNITKADEQWPEIKAKTAAELN